MDGTLEVPRGIVPHGTLLKRAETCSKCKIAPHRKGQRYCSECHADYMKDYRAAKKQYVERLEEIARVRNANS